MIRLGFDPVHHPPLTTTTIIPLVATRDLTEVDLTAEPIIREFLPLSYRTYTHPDGSGGFNKGRDDGWRMMRLLDFVFHRYVTRLEV